MKADKQEESKSVHALKARLRAIDKLFESEEVRHKARVLSLGDERVEVKTSIALILKSELSLYE